MSSKTPSAVDTIPGYGAFLDRLGAHLKATMPDDEYAALTAAASAVHASTIEAQSGETARGLDPKDESVAPQGETQNPMNYQENHSHG